MRVKHLLHRWANCAHCYPTVATTVAFQLLKRFFEVKSKRLTGHPFRHRLRHDPLGMGAESVLFVQPGNITAPKVEFRLPNQGSVYIHLTRDKIPLAASGKSPLEARPVPPRSEGRTRNRHER